MVTVPVYRDTELGLQVCLAPFEYSRFVNALFAVLTIPAKAGIQVTLAHHKRPPNFVLALFVQMVTHWELETRNSKLSQKSGKIEYPFSIRTSGMHRFFISGRISGSTASITDIEQLHHLRDVLRLRVGGEVVLFDDDGHEYRADLIGYEKKRALLSIKSRKPGVTKKLKVAIACAVPKKAKMDDIVDKLTQLEVDIIIPLETERAVVRMEENKESRLLRWKKIARSSAEQSQRNRLPVVAPLTDLEGVLVQAQDFELKVIATLNGERKNLAEILLEFTPMSVFALIGPEGDFTPQETQRAIDTRFVPVSLGSSVLRVDTAAIAIASYLKLALMR